MRYPKFTQIINILWLKHGQGAFLVVQWLGLHAPSAGGMGSITCQRTKITHAACPGQ